MNHSSDQTRQLEKFIDWFKNLDPSDQDELMSLVYSEHKVRDVVHILSMPTSAQSCVHCLGLPNDY